MVTMTAPDYTAMDATTMLAAVGDDARKWAAAFCQTATKLGHRDIDEGWMITWFASAIEHSHAVRQRPSSGLPAPLAGLETTAEERAQWIRYGDQTGYPEWTRLARAARDIDRLTAALAEAKAEAARSRADEREECAKIAETMPDTLLHMWDRPGGLPGNGYAPLRGKDVAAAIRARTEAGQTTAEYLENLPDQPFSARRP